MHGPWTVFYNLTIVSLFGAASYVGSGDTSVFAVYEAQKPVVADAPAVVATLPEPVRASTYVAPVTGNGPIVLATYTAASTEVAVPAEPVADIASPLDLVRAKVTGEAVNLRLGPSTEFDRIGSVVFGDELVLTGVTEGTWVQVEHPIDGSPVWISEKFIN